MLPGNRKYRKQAFDMVILSSNRVGGEERGEEVL
jgi:hypothetical protein